MIKKAEETPSIGRPEKWSKTEAAAAVYKLCRGKYVKAKDFPPYLYKVCRSWFGSVRAAKWEAKIIHGKSWSYEKFIKWVYQFAKPKYREDNHWPEKMQFLAKRFCGSIRKAKWEAGIIEDARKNRRNPRAEHGLWSKQKFLKKFGQFCQNGYKKPMSIPAFMRLLAVQHCGSIRTAKWQAGILKEPRKTLRK